jgi:hypothetical protein
MLAVVATSAAIASCGSPKPAPRGSSVLCTGTSATRVGTLQSPEITELSGLAASRAHPGVLWGHNDSGDVPRIFAIDESGKLRATVHINVPVAHDWEDIAITGTTIYIGDIGDNDAERSSILVHRVAEPALQDATVGATTFTLQYPDGAHDAEALMIDPLGQRLLIVTKVLSGRSSVYATSLAHPGALTRIATLALGVGQLVTAGDISADGESVALRTYTAVYLWSRRGSENLATTFTRSPCRRSPSLERQSEAIAIAPAGDAYVTSSEGMNAPIWRVTGAK